MPSLVDIVICTRNNRGIIGRTLDAIKGQTNPSLECFVVDDRSTDGTPEYIREHAPWVRVKVKTSEAPGPACSRNIGSELGAAPFVVFLDSDAYLAPDWIEQQLAFFEQHPDAGIVCGKLVLAAQPEILDCAYGAMNRYTVGWNEGAGQSARKYIESARCLFACSAAMIVRRSVLQKIGGFDEALFAFHEDTDIGWRCNLYGHPVYFNPSAVAYHDLHGTMNPGQMGPRITFMLWRNRLRSALVNYELSSLLRYVVPYIVFSLAHAALHAPRLPKLQALGWNLAHLPDTLRRRARVQKERTVSDRDLWFLFRPGLRGPNRLVLPRQTP